ncbi:MAG TPA: ATP-dependent DNA helicase [Thioalkalivibrio sp.]|nr:ATP-dependent DNA helicase [Thioalkalivibrio sp.]
MEDVTAHDALGPDGPFARLLEGFQARPQQQSMAEAVERALADYGMLIAEAGTGVGKTFAYLVPALLSGGKVIVSTGTKTLQDQLFHKDLPLVRKALGVNAHCALLKGRSNYLCLHRFRSTVAEGRLRDRQQVADLRHIRDWVGVTRTGDIGEVSGVAENAEIWAQVTSTVDNCLGQECEDYARCHVVQARRAAQEADVVVINHHLFFADLALKEEGFGELLPSANAVILDEAHQLPEIASVFFGQTLGSRQLLELSRDSISESHNEAPDMAELREHASAVEKATLDLRLALGRAGQREPWERIRHKPDVAAGLDLLGERLAALAASLEIGAERGKGLEACLRRAHLAQQRLERLQAPDERAIQWYETFTRAFQLNITPLDVAELFHSRLAAHPCAWIFTSATLAVGERFDHFSHQLGLGEAETLQLDSPFDYARNALLYLPAGLPEPNDPGYTRAVVEAALPVIRASRGRCFMLFTSHRALREAADLLHGRLPFPLLIQGDMPRGELIERFRALGNAVLLGTSSFWEGVDVRGEALSSVIIDKLPFASPGDPVLQARLNAIRSGGGNPFMDYQLPQAVIALKQGVGRLIRDAADRGVLMLCDPRLRTKQYGRIFLDSLPPVPVTRDLNGATGFFSVDEAAGPAEHTRTSR